MTTWGDLLADIRTDLKDTSASPRWSSDTLFLYAKDAIRAYSADLPKLVYREALAASNGSFPLPGSFIAVISVESAEGETLEKLDIRPGVSRRLPTRATRFFTAGGRLYLDLPPANGDTVLLTYQAVHDLPTSKDDLAMALSVPTEDEELIRLYVRAKAIEQMRTAQSGLDRFKPGSGDRDDNPLAPEFHNLMAEFNRRIAMKLGGIVQLYSPRR